MAIGKKIRIYDLARELKQDAKRVMEDLRREGADVSVPSNSVSFELAEKVRLKYFPKTEVAPKRGIKVIKATKKSESAPVEEAPEPVEVAPAEAAEVPTEEPAPQIVPDEAPPPVRKVLKKKTVEEPVDVEPAPVVVAEEALVEAEELEAVPEVEEPPVTETAGTPPRILRPSGTQIKQLTLTRDALQKGVKPG